jgi:hypothetical protein
MFKNPAIQVGGNSRIERVVGAEEEVGVSHIYKKLNKAKKLKNAKHILVFDNIFHSKFVRSQISILFSLRTHSTSPPHNNNNFSKIMFFTV